ncbi:hypothetical protein K438DRAFT_1889035 [Mycena galopus ATCC 62051]|nr:hypothetical protein K438DRAFT_1889035 [Mycena galopus ATCC 62051]
MNTTPPFSQRSVPTTIVLSIIIILCLCFPSPYLPPYPQFTSRSILSLGLRILITLGGLSMEVNPNETHAYLIASVFYAFCELAHANVGNWSTISALLSNTAIVGTLFVGVLSYECIMTLRFKDDEFYSVFRIVRIRIQNITCNGARKQSPPLPVHKQVMVSERSRLLSAPRNFEKLPKSQTI